MVLDNNNHSVFMLEYRLILPIQKLENVISEPVGERLCSIFKYIAINYNITINEWKAYSNYIDVLFKAHPNSELSKFINAYKSASSRLIKKEFFDVLAGLEDNRFWCKTFCLLTIGEPQDELINGYLNKQIK